MTGLWAQPVARVQHGQGGGASQSQAPRRAGLSWGGAQWKDPGWRNHPAACSALAACCHPAHIQHAFMSCSWRPPAEDRQKNTPPPHRWLLERRGWGGTRWKGGNGWEGITKAGGWGGWIGSWKAGYNGHWFLYILCFFFIFLLFSLFCFIFLQS